MSKHVAVLMGGWSAEREVSLRSGRACADAAELSAFSGSGEASCELPRSDKPSASNDDDIVLAVYWPPHAPTVGQAFFSMPRRSSSDILPATNAPTASNGLTMVSFWPFQKPGLIVPA